MDGIPWQVLQQGVAVIPPMDKDATKKEDGKSKTMEFAEFGKKMFNLR